MSERSLRRMDNNGEILHADESRQFQFFDVLCHVRVYLTRQIIKRPFGLALMRAES